MLSLCSNGSISTATPDAPEVHREPGSPQEEPSAHVPASHTVPHPGGGTPQPGSGGRARGQVQPGPQKPLLRGIRRAGKRAPCPALFKRTHARVSSKLLDFFSAPPPLLQRYQSYSSRRAPGGRRHGNGAAQHLQQRAGESVQQLDGEPLPPSLPKKASVTHFCLKSL